MHPRYTRQEIAEIWTEKNRFQIWTDIECHVCDAQAEMGIIPKQAAKIIREKARFNPERIAEIEKVTHHEVVAFLTNLAEYIGPDARFVHQGLTSSDILDTCLNIQLTQAADILDQDILLVMEALKKQAFAHRLTPTIGRSHGIHAEPTSFGLKMASHYAEFARNRERLAIARKEIATCAISGAVGTFAHLGVEVEAYVAKAMHLEIEPISTQIIPRDRHAAFFSTLGIIASSIERIAVEIRHLQRSEVREVEEHFFQGQKGSSAMPHKRNPVLSENITGLARIVRAGVIPALENVVLWHERDISHSSVERMMAPDMTTALDFALFRLASIVKNLQIYPENMQANLDKTCRLYASQRLLLALTQKGISREKAYETVQKHAMRAWKEEIDFVALIKKDKEITQHFSEEDLDNMGDIKAQLSYVDVIFSRVFGDGDEEIC